MDVSLTLFEHPSAFGRPIVQICIAVCFGRHRAAWTHPAHWTRFADEKNAQTALVFFLMGLMLSLKQ